MRATSTSPFLKRIPDPAARISHASARADAAGIFAISRYGAIVRGARVRGGFTSNICGMREVRQPSGSSSSGVKGKVWVKRDCARPSSVRFIL